MLLRLIAAVLGVLGLVAIGLGVASATVWRPADTLTATGQTDDGVTLLTTAPGVLEIGDPPVTVTATAPEGTQVVLAMGRYPDVTAWIGSDAHTVVTGLSDWDTLATEDVASTAPTAVEGDAAAEGDAAGDPAATPEPATPAQTPAPDPTGSDLWVEQATGAGSAELVWTPREGRWTLLAAAVGEDPGALTLELSWPRTVTTPWLVPGIAVGVVLLLLAAVLAVRSRGAARRGEERQRVAAGPEPVVERDAAVSRDGTDAEEPR